VRLGLVLAYIVLKVPKIDISSTGSYPWKVVVLRVLEVFSMEGLCVVGLSRVFLLLCKRKKWFCLGCLGWCTYYCVLVLVLK